MGLGFGAPLLWWWGGGEACGCARRGCIWGWGEGWHRPSSAPAQPDQRFPPAYSLGPYRQNHRRHPR
jgi:hypothetical protein